MAPPTNARARLEELGPERVRPGLVRVRRLLEQLGSPHLAYPTAIVAGTNGKGSTVAMLESIGRFAGLRVGAYTSPHLCRLEERLRVGGVEISSSGFEMHLGAVLEAADALVTDGVLEQSPSYFEVLTALAFRYFAEARVDLAVLEVGLGGRLDATNVTVPRVAVITSIAHDHGEWLGDDLVAIAKEKFAVVPDSGLAVLAPQPAPVLEALRDEAAARGITLLEADRYELRVREADERLRYRFDLAARLRSYGGLEVALPGRHQVDNARSAVLAAEALDRRRMRITSDAVWAGLRRASLPGRCEWIDSSPPVLLDGAHNPAGAAVLATHLQQLRERGAYRRLHLVMGALRDKDLVGILGPLTACCDTFIATRPPSPRAASAPDLLDAAGSSPAARECIPEPEAALARALQQAEPDDLICITGSLYLLGCLRPLVAPGPEDQGPVW